MNTTILLFIFVMLTCSSTKASDEQCFNFKGNSYLLFSLGDNYDNKDMVHYEFEFQTSALNGVLMYARGRDSDFEALYIQGGNLHYFLYNTSPSGVGQQFGKYTVSSERVDNNAWTKVHLYRSYPVLDSIYRSRHNKTGFEFQLTGTSDLSSYVDNWTRTGIDISSNIYFGGYVSPLSRTVGNFTGKIRGIREEKNDYIFENPSLNYKSLVDLHCQD